MVFRDQQEGNVNKRGGISARKSWLLASTSQQRLWVWMGKGYGGEMGQLWSHGPASSVELLSWGCSLPGGEGHMEWDVVMGVIGEHQGSSRTQMQRADFSLGPTSTATEPRRNSLNEVGIG